jgi:hypothetical protein
MTNIKPPGRYLSIKKDGGAKSTKGAWQADQKKWERPNWPLPFFKSGCSL